MSSRSLFVAAVSAIAVAGPAAADTSGPPVKTPDQAVAMIKRLFAHNTKRCRLDWARIHAVGEPGYWYISAAIRSSKAGKGGAHWTIRNGPPVAHGHLAHAISHGCG